jgi:hypothetical protein
MAVVSLATKQSEHSCSYVFIRGRSSVAPNSHLYDGSERRSAALVHL